ncbi:hypothetical protein BYI23_B004520 [Burkholderia sp. YI23]|nr:hypothetical protein BYI23_B004520 [Burkholderia sp. YI23]
MRVLVIEINGGNSFTLHEGDRYHDELCWDELLGMVAEMTHPRLGDGRYGLRTREEWTAWRRSMRPTQHPVYTEPPLLTFTPEK